MVRTLLSALLAFGVVIGLFLLMNALISVTDEMDEKPKEIPINIGFVDEDKQVQRKERRPPKKPPPPKEPPPPQQQQQQKQQKLVTAVVDIQIDDLDSSMDGQGIYIGGLGQAQTDFSGFGDGEAIPMYQVKPEYPQKANLNGVTGYVTFKFDVGPDGTPSNISVIDEKPRNTFRKNAKRAIRKWKFKPRIVNGQPITQRGLTYKLEFSLED